jgi:hypothetical protein
MATVQTVNFSSVIIDGTRVELEGRLTRTTRDNGLKAWEATGVLHDPSLQMRQLATSREMMRAEFETRERGRLAGQVFVSRWSESSSRGVAQTLVTLSGTGPLEGWSAK